MNIIISQHRYCTTVGQQPNNTVISYPNVGKWVPAFSFLNALYKIVLRGNQSSNLLAIVEELIYIDETIRVLNGTLQVYLDGYQFCAPAGTSFYIPRNVIQSHRNLGSKPIHVELIFTPSNIDNYLEEVTPVFAAQPVNMTRAGELARKFGVVHLPDIPWKDLNCAFNDSTLLISSLHMTFFIIVLHIFVFICDKLQENF
ncbi:unnamed protein product [Rotaria sordida]|uniref:Cupin type-2 domain-containing protein n=1 Tax=Rotaria sordida TaxID=392033 RepID=A0A818WVA6_9BILA|nr:unnamed protein product [Rotaria sordida]